MRCTILAGALLAFGIVRAESSGERLVYTRSDTLSVVTGESSIKRAYTRQLRLPSHACDGKPFSCTADRMYGQVYVVSFVEETVARGADQKPAVTRSDRGRVAIAVNFPKEAENKFEDSLVDSLEHLSVAAFARRHAGFGTYEGPLSQSALSQSDTLAWVCADDPDRCGCDYRLFGDTHNETSSYSIGLPAVCRAIERAVDDAEPTLLRTMPEVREELRWSVKLSSSSALGDSTWANRLVELPQGASLKKRALERGARTGAVRDSRGGVFVGREGRYAGVERAVELPRASLDLAGTPMWVSNWAIESVRERMGTDPRVESGPSLSLLVAVAPIADPTMSPLAGSRRELSVPTDALTAAVIERLQRSASLRPAAIVSTLADPALWPASGDWIVVTCTDDGKARYGVAPFVDAAAVDNAREACAAIRTTLGN